MKNKIKWNNYIRSSLIGTNKAFVTKYGTFNYNQFGIYWYPTAKGGDIWKFYGIFECVNHEHSFLSRDFAKKSLVKHLESITIEN